MKIKKKIIQMLFDEKGDTYFTDRKGVITSFKLCEQSDLIVTEDSLIEVNYMITNYEGSDGEDYTDYFIFRGKEYLNKHDEMKVQLSYEMESEPLNIDVSISLPSRKDYDRRKLKEMYFKEDTTVDGKVLFVKGDEWQPYNWYYSRTIEYLKNGRLGYDHEI